MYKKLYKNTFDLVHIHNLSTTLFISIYCSHDGKYITAGSENQCVYIWRANPESNNLTVRKDRSSHWEAIKGMLFCLLLVT